MFSDNLHKIYITNRTTKTADKPKGKLKNSAHAKQEQVSVRIHAQ